MFLCTDVAYGDDSAAAAGVVFETWDSHSPVNSYVVKSQKCAPYEPGQFYQRELPILLQLLDAVNEPIHCILVDGFVWLDEERPGLGQHLYEALQDSCAVVGVAKTAFAGNRAALPVCRGESKKPLWITTSGLDAASAATSVATMAGDFRIPELLKCVDRLCRDALEAANQ